MKIVLAVLLATAVAVNGKAVFKRNSYGDEAVTPAPEAPAASEAPVQEQAPEAGPEQVVAETVAPVDQAPSEKSGYRKRREAQNSYGDEPVAETPAATEAPAVETTAAVQEQAPEAVAAETVAPADQPPAEKSGYRKRRDAQNSYGDEPVTEASAKQEYPQDTVPETTPVAEVVPEQVPVETPAAEAPVEHSGY